MKYFLSVFLSILFLLLFSCSGTPASPPEERAPEPARPVETPIIIEDVKDEVITEEPQDFIEIVELAPEEEQITDDIIDDNAEELTEELAEDDADDYAEELTEEEPAIDDISGGFEIADLDDQAGDEPVPVEEPPAAETAPQVTQSSIEQPPPPVSAPPPAQPQAPPPTPEPEPEPQTPAPPPMRPPVPPPALLGPAEERPSSQRETVPPRRELWRDPPAPVTGSEPPIRPGITPQNDSIVFSRTVRATVGQIVEIPFMGTGWVYMGELASRRGIVYSSTRRDPEGQSFIFGAEEVGTYALKFFKEDFLRGYILNDHVQVIVGEAPSASGTGWFAPPYDRGRVTAQPRWPSALDAQQRETEESRPAQTPAETGGSRAAADIPPPVISSPPQGTTVPRGTPVITEPAVTAVPERQEILEPDVILQKAKETFEEGNAAAAIALLDQFREHYPSGSDELYWLYGQFYEANTPSRSILLALDYYRRLVDEYPQSSRYNDARRRIAYLERFYINIQ